MSVDVTLWGTRGSIATPGPETRRYGGNTACVEVRGDDGTVLVLDAGTGIRRLGVALGHSVPRLDLLLTHLHMDHIQGLGFFGPLFDPRVEVHIYGPASTTLSLRDRLTRYLSPPLFPVHLRDLLGSLRLHEMPTADFDIAAFRISSALVCHPNPTVGYRISGGGAVVAYLPDHEPALGLSDGFLSPEWTSGYDLAADADLLIHDTQYGDDEYRVKIGWGHSSIRQAIEFAALAGVKHLVAFHHDPSHTDDHVDALIRSAVKEMTPTFQVSAAVEGATFSL